MKEDAALDHDRLRSQVNELTSSCDAERTALTSSEDSARDHATALETEVGNFEAQLEKAAPAQPSEQRDKGKGKAQDDTFGPSVEEYQNCIILYQEGNE